VKKVKDFMNKNVVSLSPDDTLFDAAKKLCESNISGAPVVEKGKLVGVISISDIIRFIDIRLGRLPKVEFPGLSWVVLAFIKMQKLRMDLRKELEKTTKSKVREVMSKNVITASPSMSLIEAAELMEKHDINRLPVVSNGKLVGIVARADLIRALISD
jgi:CBS domain-containing protein